MDEVTVTCFPNKRYGGCTQPGVHAHTYTVTASTPEDAKTIGMTPPEAQHATLPGVGESPQ